MGTKELVELLTFVRAVKAEYAKFEDFVIRHGERYPRRRRQLSFELALFLKKKPVPFKYRDSWKPDSKVLAAITKLGGVRKVFRALRARGVFRSQRRMYLWIQQDRLPKEVWIDFYEMLEAIGEAPEHYGIYYEKPLYKSDLRSVGPWSNAQRARMGLEVSNRDPGRHKSIRRYEREQKPDQLVGEKPRRQRLQSIPAGLPKQPPSDDK